MGALIKLPAIAALGFLPMLRPTWPQRLRSAVVVGATAAVTGATLTWATGLGYGWLHTLNNGSARLSIYSPATGLGVGVGKVLDALGLVDTPETIVRIVFASGLAVAGLVAVVLLLRAHAFGPLRSLGLALVVVVALAPVVQPWYLLWGLVLLAAVGGEKVTLALGAISVALCLSLLPNGTSLIRPPLYGAPLLLAAAFAAFEVRRATEKVIEPVPASTAATEELAASYRTCRQVSATHGRTYYLAARLLPADVRPSVHALYAFARVADEVVDDLRSTASTEQRRSAPAGARRPRLGPPGGARLP